MSVLEEIKHHFYPLMERKGSQGIIARGVYLNMCNYMQNHEHEMTRDQALQMCRDYYAIARDEELAKTPNPDDFVSPAVGY